MKVENERDSILEFSLEATYFVGASFDKTRDEREDILCNSKSRELFYLDRKTKDMFLIKHGNTLNKNN